MLSQVNFHNSIEFNQTSQKVASNINIQFNTSPNFRKDYIWMVFWEHFLEEFLERNSLGGIFWEEFFAYIGIDLFVKILSLGRRRKEEKFQSLEVRVQANRTWKFFTWNSGYENFVDHWQQEIHSVI